MAGLDSTVTGCAANVLSNAFCSLWKKVVQEVKMVISMPQALHDMQGEVERLDSVIHDINAEINPEQIPKRVVKTWLDNAGEAIESSRSIDNKYQTYQRHRNCLGCCPNCLSRYRISKDIREWKRNVDELHSKRQSDFPPSGDYADPSPRNQIQIQNSKFAGNGIQTAESQLEKWLTDDNNIRIIGVHGMGGVGKTSLLQTINNSFNVSKKFDLIVWVTVSKNHILDLQKSVADRLNFKLPDNFEMRKAMLRSSLENRKVLLILDDIWADSDILTSDDLQNLGVSWNDRGFKMVLTTRDKEVCARMNVQETITVEPLLEEEGWQLFRSRAFRNRDGNVPREMEEVAWKIAKECRGLPLAIIVVAAAMAHHTYLYEWEDALDQMQNVPETFYDLHPVVDKLLFQRLKWSYNALKSDHLKTCFLYFAAYPEDGVIYCEEIIDIWIAEGLVKRSGEGYLHDTGHSYISHLRDRCLIEVVETNIVGRIEAVKMHDVLRDLAILIAQNEHGCYFKAGQGVSHFPVEEVDGKGYARMSLMYNRLESLPTTLACSSLSVLLLTENRGIKEVPGSFLGELSSLKVLDLSDTDITSLPPCIGNMKHLASLRLQDTRIRELPETIGDLKELQLLNLSYCKRLRCLPERISQLKRLRVLDTTRCLSLSHLPHGISELVSLEILKMYRSISLDFEEAANGERKHACLKDLQSLRRLRVFSGQMKSTVKESVMGNWSKMRDLHLICSPANQDYLPQDMQAMKFLESFRLWKCDVEQLPSRVSEFQKLATLGLSECTKLKALPEELQELPCLRALWIDRCDKLEVLDLGKGYPKLEEVRLRSLESLECVRAVAAATSGSGGLVEGTLPSPMLQSPESLECAQTVVAASGSGGLGEGASPSPMLKSIEVILCNKLKTLPGRWDKLNSLQEISGDRQWWDALQWEDPEIKASLESKFRDVPDFQT